MRQNIILFSTLIFSLTAMSSPQYPPVCEEMTALAREIASMNEAMISQMKSLEVLEKQQREQWATASDEKRVQMERFCRDSRAKLLNIKKTINVIFQQAK